MTSISTSCLKDAAVALGDKAKVVKIDVDKNSALAEALRVKGLPTLMFIKMEKGNGVLVENRTLIL